MHHRVTDFDACWKTVEDQPADLRLQDGDQIAESEQIVLRAVERGRQLALHRASDVQKVLSARVGDQERRRSEDLLAQIGMREVGLSVRLEEGGVSRASQ